MILSVFFLLLSGASAMAGTAGTPSVSTQQEAIQSEQTQQQLQQTDQLSQAEQALSIEQQTLQNIQNRENFDAAALPLSGGAEDMDSEGAVIPASTNSEDATTQEKSSIEEVEKARHSTTVLPVKEKTPEQSLKKSEENSRPEVSRESGGVAAISIQDAMEGAYKLSPLMLAEYKVKGAQNTLINAKAGWLPTLSGTLGYNYTSTATKLGHQIQNSSSGQRISQKPTAGLTLNQNLYN